MRLLITLLIAVVLLAVGTLLWTGHQSTRLPGWYLEARAADRLEPDLDQAARDARQSLVGRFGRELIDEVTADDGTPDESFLDRIQRRGKMVLEDLREGREVRLDAADIEGVVLAMAHESEDGRELLAAARAVRAEISDGELEIGAVVALTQLPAEQLDPSYSRLLELFLRLAGSDGEIYLSLRAAPAAVDDRLLLVPPIRLRAGELTLRPALLTALGVAASELDSGLALDVGRMKVRQASIDGEILVLVVSPDL